MVEETVPCRLAVRVRAIIMHEGKLLVVRHRLTNPHYVLPGGHLDFGELPAAGLARELTEEFGVTAIIGRLLYVHTFTQVLEKENVQSFECFFAIDNGGDFLNISSEASHAHELAEIHWLSPGEEVTLLPKAVHDDFKNGTWPERARVISD